MRRGQYGFWLALVSPAVLPWLSEYLPFQDFGLHLGVVSALVYFDDPEANLTTVLERVSGNRPNLLFSYLAYWLSFVLPPLVATKAILSLSLGALAPAVARLCKSVGADPRAALLIIPIAIGRHVYCGFAPNAAALVFMALAFSFWIDLLRGNRRSATLFTICLVLTGLFHGFVFLATAGLLFVSALFELPKNYRRAGLAVVILSASVVILVPTFAVEGVSSSLSASWSALVSAAKTENRDNRWVDLWQWLFAVLRYQKIDDWLQTAWAGGFLSLVLLGIKKDCWKSGSKLFVFGAIALVMFVVLPTNIGPPVNWWGAGLRLPPMAVILWVPVAGLALNHVPLGPPPGVKTKFWVRRVFEKLSLAAFALGSSASIMAVIYLFSDLIDFGQTEGKGLMEVVSKIPKGKRISVLHSTSRRAYEYPGEPFGYAASYYSIVQGGYSTENGFEHGVSPFKRKFSPPTAPWGHAAGFRYESHAPFVDGFLTHPAPGSPEFPFARDSNKVKLIVESGAWRYYEKIGERHRP